jgi:hypothetical protein
MRIRVKDVLDLLAARVPEAEILADFPDLEAEDIQACLEYAAEQLDHPVLLMPHRHGKPVAELRRTSQPKVDRLAPDPDLKPLAIDYDPTEPLGEDEWPSEYR